MILESFFTRATPNLKKKRDTSIFSQVTVFFTGRPDLKLTFQFQAVSERTRDRTRTSSPTARSRVTITFLPTQFSQLKLYFTAAIANYA